VTTPVGNPNDALRHAFQAWRGNRTGEASQQEVQRFANETAHRLGMQPQEVVQSLSHDQNAVSGEAHAQHQDLARELDATLSNALMAVVNPAQAFQTLMGHDERPADERNMLGSLLERAEEGGGHLMDNVDSALNWPTQQLAQATADIPVLGTLTGALAETVHQSEGFVSGFVRGVGELVGAVGNVVAHPVSTLTGLYNVAAHIPMLPANPLRLLNAGAELLQGQSMEQVWNQELNPVTTFQQDLHFGGALLDAVTGPIVSDFEHGEWGRGLGRIAPVILGAIASDGATAAVEGAEVAAVAGETATVARTAEVAEAARAAEVAEAAQAARAAEAAEASEAAEAAETLTEAGVASEVAEGSRLAHALERVHEVQEVAEHVEHVNHAANVGNNRHAGPPHAE
jgi:hypothetical protein